MNILLSTEPGETFVSTAGSNVFLLPQWRQLISERKITELQRYWFIKWERKTFNFKHSLTLTPSRRVKIPFSRGMKQGLSLVTHVSSVQCCLKLLLTSEPMYRWHWTHFRKAPRAIIASTLILLRRFQRMSCNYIKDDINDRFESLC